MPYLAAAGQAITVIRRAAWATAALAAVLIAVTAHRQDETLRQVVAELARLRAAVYGRSADEQRLMIAVAAEGYRRGRADGGPDAETLRTIYWNAYTDVLSDLGGSAPAER